MSDSPETLAAILADYRADIPAMTSRELPHPTPEYLRILLDRIEAAAERETESLRVKAESEKRWACEYFDLARRREDALLHCKRYAQKIERENEEGETRLDAEEIVATPGNAAELREALIYVRDLMRRVKDGDRISSLAFLGVVEHAIAAPARNCDVGTAEEQAERLKQFCLDNHSAERLCSRCPLGKQLGNDVDMCQLHWAQMPYAPAEGGAE